MNNCEYVNSACTIAATAIGEALGDTVRDYRLKSAKAEILILCFRSFVMMIKQYDV